MPHSPPWSDTFATCRLEWRPSRWLVGALIALAMLAPFAVLVSEMPRVAAWPLALVAGAHGLRLAWREWRKPPRILDVPLAHANLHWRGPLLFLRRGSERASWWPDTLAMEGRAELRRATQLHCGSGGSRDRPEPSQ
jgi:toxin CptA